MFVSTDKLNGDIISHNIIPTIERTIHDWHSNSSNFDRDRVIVTDAIKNIRPLGLHRDNLYDVIRELVLTNTEMWHEEDKVRSADDQMVLKAIRNINPLNQHRNDLIEEIDEIIAEWYTDRTEDTGGR